MERSPRPRIVIAGGGFAGIETALYLRRRLGDRGALTLLTDRSHFIFRPFLAYVPFGLLAEDAQIDLGAVARAQGIELVRGQAGGLDPAGRTVQVDGAPLPYDRLVVATGATIGPEEVEGLHAHDHVYTLWRPVDAERLRDAFEALLRQAHAGRRPRVVFLVPPLCRWAGPLYEMAFMLATWLTWQNARRAVELAFVTPENGFMEAFGPELDGVLDGEFERAGIAGYRQRVVRCAEDGHLVDEAGHRIPFDLLVTAPTPIAATDWAPLPRDAQGFLRTVPATRQVVDHPGIYAVGDAADYPVKQAFLALLQADAAAEHLAAGLLGTEPRFGFDPEGLWLLEQLDQGVLARAFLPADPEAMIQPAAEVNRLPVGQLRRLLAGAHLPRAVAGNPLYAGLFWKGTQVGLKVIEQLRRPSAAPA